MANSPHAPRGAAACVGLMLLLLWGCDVHDGGDPMAPAAPLITGVVLDLQAEPVAGLLVRAGECEECRSVTGTDGRFRVTLNPGAVKYVLEIRDEESPDSIGAWYDVVTDSLDVLSENEQRVIMIPNIPESCEDFYSLCDTPADNLGFLCYLKMVTFTYLESHCRFKKWEHGGPVTFWVEPDTSTYGYPLYPIGIEALQAWEERVGEDLFTEVADSSQAELLICFGYPGWGAYFGLTTVTDPPSCPYATCNPRRMRIVVRDDLRFAGTCRYTTLHEIGHTLGFWNHSPCYGDVMTPGSLYVPDDVALAPLIGSREALAVKAFRLLAADCDMRWYQDRD